MENKTSSDANKINEFEQKIQYFREKLLHKEEELNILRQQMVENDQFRESVFLEANEIKKKFSLCQKTINELNSKYILQKKRCDKMARAQSNFLRNLKDTKRSYKGDREEYWNSIVLKLEKDNANLRKSKNELAEQHKVLSLEYKHFKKNSKKKEVEYKHKIKENLFGLKKVNSELIKCSFDNEKMQDDIKSLVQENRQLKLVLNGYDKKLDEYENVFNKTIGNRLVELDSNENKLVGKYMKIPKKKTRMNSSPASLEKKKNIPPLKNSMLHVERELTFSARKRSKRNDFSPKGKITQKGFENIIKGDSQVIDGVLKEIDKNEENRIDLSEFDKDKDKITIEDAEKHLEEIEGKKTLFEV